MSINRRNNTEYSPASEYVDETQPYTIKVVPETKLEHHKYEKINSFTSSITPPKWKFKSFFKKPKRSRPGSKISQTDSAASGSIKRHLEDYCASTSIHGLKYLGEKNRPLGERLWWLVVFVMCLSGNAYLIGKVWKKWNDSPVIVSFAETTTPVWQVPFPAVTFCNEQKAVSSVFNFTKVMLMNDTDEETAAKRGAMSLICDPNVIAEDIDYINESMVDFLVEVAPTLDDTIIVCFWKNNITEDCSHLFSPVFTEDGVCYTFNMLSMNDMFRKQGIPHFEEHGKKTDGWTLEDGYLENSPIETYPERALKAGSKDGLIVVLKARSNDHDFRCRGPVQGFKVLLHNPAEMPTIGDRYLRVPLKEETLVVLQPNIMTTSRGLRSYSPHGRQCYFSNERYLAYFKIYTQRNCELECLTNFTRRICGCVAPHMPRFNGTKLCGAGNKPCINSAREKLTLLEIKSSYSKKFDDFCDCLPACTSIEYEAETSQANFIAAPVVSANSDNLTELDGIEIARLTIFFKDMQFTTSKRSELFGLVDFLANCGGLLGLFCGVSLLSFVEILYYLTLRFWSNVHHVQRKRKASKAGANAA